MSWKPIETAPKDGTEFQAWIKTTDGQEFWEPRARYLPDTEIIQFYGRTDDGQDGWDYIPWLKPTHWMLQPKPPTE